MKKIGDYLDSIKLILFSRKNKKAVMTDYLVWIIIAIVVLTIAFYFAFKEKSFLSGFIADLRNKLRFGF